MEMCRACLVTGKDMIQMDEQFVNNYNLITSINVSRSDDMPLYSCLTCFNAVNYCIEFREKCIASDLTLKEILFPGRQPEKDVKSDEDTCEVKIKQEIKLEYNNNSSEELDTYECEYLYDPDDEFLISSNKDIDWSPNKSIKTPKKKKKDLYNMVKLKRASKETYKLKRKHIPEDNKKHCGICTKKFDDNEALTKHFEHHTQDKACGQCPERFFNFPHLLSHRLKHVPESQMRCHLCSQRFIAEGYLEFHYIKKHNLGGEGAQLLCKVCAAPYSNPIKLQKHMWSVHSEIKYTCDECGKGYRTKNLLKSHMVNHTAEKRYVCDLCDFSCKFNSGIREHKIRRHTEGRVYCKSCGRAFASQEKLDKHNCKQTTGVVCPMCGIFIKKASLLPRHIKSHNHAYLFKCDRCPAGFKTKASFTAHVNKHDGKRTFHCEYCTKSFYSCSVLIKHRRVHTGEKPYVCKLCSRGFTGNYNLKVHMKGVHGINLIVKKPTDADCVFTVPPT